MHYLNYSDRLRIEAWLRVGLSKCDIARQLGCCLATVYNELKRGEYIARDSEYREIVRYSPEIAQRSVDFNVSSRGPSLKIGSDHEFSGFLAHMIRDLRYSPVATLAYIKRHQMYFKTAVCRSTIYNYIRRGDILDVKPADLPFHGKRLKHLRQSRRYDLRQPSRGVCIESRPADAASRLTFGHWEMDSVIGTSARGQTLLVLTERQTRYQLIFRSNDKSAQSTATVLNGVERFIGTAAFRRIFRSITVDNGTEFNADLISTGLAGDRRTDVYYCHPYCSSERGSNEKQNQMIRRWIRKSTRIEQYTDADLHNVTSWLNEYPRELFGFRSASDLLPDYARVLLSVC